MSFSAPVGSIASILLQVFFTLGFGDSVPPEPDAGRGAPTVPDAADLALPDYQHLPAAHVEHVETHETRGACRVPNLRRATEGVRNVSTQIDAGHRAEARADLLADFLDAISVPRVTVLGHSMGGVVAAAFAFTQIATGGNKKKTRQELQQAAQAIATTSKNDVSVGIWSLSLILATLSVTDGMDQSCTGSRAARTSSY